MDYEKLHKDTITKLQEMVNSGKITVETARGICADFVPESEDERIRKLLIEAVIQVLQDQYCSNRGVSKEKVVAWLEEQGEKKLYVNDNAKEMFIKALERVEEQNNKGYKLTDCDKNSWWEDFKAYTSCTIEQKPAIWSEEDNYNFTSALGCVAFCKERLKEKDDYEHCLDWLKSLKDRVQPQPKQEWSEEDEKMKRGLIVICDEWTTRHSFYPIENCEMEKLKNWIKNLKDRI